MMEESALKDVNSRVRIFQFGSSLFSENPNDIDILIIYTNNKLLNFTSIITMKRFLKEKLEIIYNLPVDIIMLSESELSQLAYKIETYKLLAEYN